MVRGTGSVYPWAIPLVVIQIERLSHGGNLANCDSFLTGGDHDKRANNDAKPSGEIMIRTGKSVICVIITAVERKEITH